MFGSDPKKASVPDTTTRSSFLPQQWTKWGLVIIVSLMPFHAFLSVWLGALTGHQALIQAWKEVLIISLVCAAGLALLASPELRGRLTRPTNLLAIAFIGLGLLVSLVTGHTGTRQFWFGAKTDLEFVVLFIVAQVVASRPLARHLMGIMIATASVVAIFGIVQVFFLPPDFLKVFGYGPATILPYRLVDPAVPNGIRILSTLSGPNQLGSFLILPICVCAYLLLKRRWWAFGPLLASLFILFHSFSRSAWIGATIALILTIFLSVRRRIAIMVASIILVALILAGVAGRSAVLNQTKLQYYLLHGRFFSQQVEGSDQNRLSSLGRGFNEVKQHPFGQGLGSAGPASYQGNKVIITENFYAQLAIETGVLGLLIFCTWLAFVGAKLFRIRRSYGLAIPLLAALVGLSAANLFLHTWADSSTALVFWAITGAVVELKARGLRHD